ncbi:hypothetical protein WA158_006501 [Blastocystis sp. Blastoise]
MSSGTILKNRLQSEIKILQTSPPPGIFVYPDDENMYSFKADITGPEGSPYEDGLFKVSLTLPERYPFEPPKVRFDTPIYHPNIDSNGRICLDLLKMPPAGNWAPSINISTLLTSIRLLIAEPNAKDGLVPEISELFLKDKEQYQICAKEFTLKHAMNKTDIPKNEIHSGSIIKDESHEIRADKEFIPPSKTYKRSVEDTEETLKKTSKDPVDENEEQESDCEWSDES